MSEEAMLYGCVVGTHSTTANWYGLYPLNRAVIDSLPEEDGYPPLTRGMFAAPAGDDRSGPGFYRHQMIHFGASFNHFSEDWHLWLEKFEALLQRLYWREAYLHLEIEFHGRHEYHWSAAAAPFYDDPPRPTAEWTFEGRPRDFRPA